MRGVEDTMMDITVAINMDYTIPIIITTEKTESETAKEYSPIRQKVAVRMPYNTVGQQMHPHTTRITQPSAEVVETINMEIMDKRTLRPMVIGQGVVDTTAVE